MNRIATRARQARAQGGGLFVPFVVIGDPDLETSMAITASLIEGGADMLEFGFPFSDPPADGPVIQAADVRALEAGVTTEAAFEFLAEVGQRWDVPVALLVYYNLILQYGVDAFYARAAAVGVDAILVADVPLELSENLVAAGRKHGVSPVFIASTLSTPERLQKIAEVAEGYIYAVSRVGITGEQRAVDGGLPALLAKIRAAIELPILVGFGISTPEHVRAVIEAGADGAICGSAIVRRIEAHLDDRDAMLASVQDFVRAMKDAAAPHKKD